jgi:hypothetical protein
VARFVWREVEAAPPAEAGQPAKRARKFRDRYRDTCRAGALACPRRRARRDGRKLPGPLTRSRQPAMTSRVGTTPRAKGFGERVTLGARKTRRPRPARRRLHRKRYGLSEAISRRVRAARAMMTPADLSRRRGGEQRGPRPSLPLVSGPTAGSQGEAGQCSAGCRSASFAAARCPRRDD